MITSLPQRQKTGNGRPPKECMGKEREVVEHDQHHIQIPIHFVENETIEMASTNDGTTPIERLPNEILEKILSEALLSSGC